MIVSLVWILCVFSIIAWASPRNAKIGLETRQPPPEEESSSDDGSGSTGDEESMFNDHGDYITCNRMWYGRPAIRDCDLAIEQLPDFFERGHTYREFLGILGPSPTGRAPGMDGPPVQTPIFKTYSM